MKIKIEAEIDEVEDIYLKNLWESYVKRYGDSSKAFLEILDDLRSTNKVVERLKLQNEILNCFLEWYDKENEIEKKGGDFEDEEKL